MWWVKVNKIAEKEKWHKWFAWRPVSVSVFPDGNKKMVWLEPVYRCGELCFWGVDCHWEWKYSEFREEIKNERNLLL